MKDKIEYYNRDGRPVFSEDEAYSKIICNPHDFQFFIKKRVKKIFKNEYYTKWEFYQRKSMLFGGGLKASFVEDSEKYYDIQGKQVFSEDEAYSKVISKPHDFKFYVKRRVKKWFRDDYYTVWDYHHTSSTFGSWMWPEGMPLIGDGLDNIDIAIKHRDKVNYSHQINRFGVSSSPCNNA